MDEFRVTGKTGPCLAPLTDACKAWLFAQERRTGEAWTQSPKTLVNEMQALFILADGTFSRVAVNPESQRRKSAKAWEAKSEVAKVRHSLDLTQEAFADLLGIGLSTLRSWEQRKREPSGAARMLIAIALKHPEVFQEAVA